MSALFLSAFISLFVVIDPPGCAPIFTSLTSGSSLAHQRRMAIRSVINATLILFGFAVAGEPLLRHLGISLDAFRIAGGLLLFLIALEMVFEKRNQRREDRAEKVAQQSKAEHGVIEEDISVFPMGIPMLAGPGSIATVILLTSKANGHVETFIVLGALAAVLVITLVSLLLAGSIMRLLGPKMEAMLTRLLGVLLAALAVQFVIDGLRAAFAA